MELGMWKGVKKNGVSIYSLFEVELGSKPFMMIVEFKDGTMIKTTPEEVEKIIVKDKLTSTKK